MITTISPVNICTSIVTFLHVCVCVRVLRTFKIYSEQPSNTQYSINYGHHAVPDSPTTYLVYDWKFIHFEPLSPISNPSTTVHLYSLC